MAVAIKNVLIQSTFMSADEARSHATRAHAESAWQHCDAPQFSEKNVHDRTKMWNSTYFVPRAWDALSSDLRSTIRWCELLCVCNRHWAKTECSLAADTIVHALALNSIMSQPSCTLSSPSPARVAAVSMRITGTAMRSHKPSCAGRYTGLFAIRPLRSK